MNQSNEKPSSRSRRTEIPLSNDLGLKDAAGVAGTEALFVHAEIAEGKFRRSHRPLFFEFRLITQEVERD